MGVESLSNPFTTPDSGHNPIPDLGDVPMEAAILAHVHPLGPVSGQGVDKHYLCPL